MPSTDFATGWMGDPFLLLSKAGLELATLGLPISCSTY